MQGSYKPYSMAVNLSKSRQKFTHVNLLRSCDSYPSCILVVFTSRTDYIDFGIKIRPLLASPCIATFT